MVALIRVVTSLRGLTTSAHVVGTTLPSQAEALYRQALGASAGQRAHYSLRHSHASPRQAALRGGPTCAASADGTGATWSRG